MALDSASDAPIPYGPGCNSQRGPRLYCVRMKRLLVLPIAIALALLVATTPAEAATTVTATGTFCDDGTRTYFWTFGNLPSSTNVAWIDHVTVTGPGGVPASLQNLAGTGVHPNTTIGVYAQKPIILGADPDIVTFWWKPGTATGPGSGALKKKTAVPVEVAPPCGPQLLASA